MLSITAVQEPAAFTYGFQMEIWPSVQQQLKFISNDNKAFLSKCSSICISNHDGMHQCHPRIYLSNRIVSGRLCASDTFKWMHFKHRFRQSEPAVDKTSTCPHELTVYCMIRSTTLVQVSRCCVTAFIFLLWYKGYAGVMKAYYWWYIYMWFS